MSGPEIEFSGGIFNCCDFLMRSLGGKRVVCFMSADVEGQGCNGAKGRGRCTEAHPGLGHGVDDLFSSVLKSWKICSFWEVVLRNFPYRR